jgi:hypothetical protein
LAEKKYHAKKNSVGMKNSMSQKSPLGGSSSFACEHIGECSAYLKFKLNYVSYEIKLDCSHFMKNMTSCYFSANTLKLQPGVDVMITVFCDFRQFSAQKLAFFSKTNVMIKI